MNMRVKLFLAFLAVIAVFALYKITTALQIFNPSQVPVTKQTPLPDLGNDFDQDGLSNQEEAYWNSDPYNPDSDGDGFKDGEEAATGHSPLIPRPDDLINADNLTEKVSVLALAGLAAGDLNPDNDNYGASLTNIADAIEDSSQIYFGQTIEPSSLQPAGSGRDATLAYVKDLFPVLNQLSSLLAKAYGDMETDLNAIGQEGFNDALRKKYKDETRNLNDILSSFQKIKPSKETVEIQAAILTFVQKLKLAHAAIANGQKDPIKATVGLNVIADSQEEYFQIFQKIILLTK